MKAVVAHEINRLAVEDVSLDPPQAGEVLVKMSATGVCHSDLSVLNGTLPLPLPMVLGHEGAGVVDQVGEGVRNVKPGDHVVLSFQPACGDCFFCVRGESFLCTCGAPTGRMLDGTARVKLEGKDLGVMQFLGNMAEYAVVPSISVVRIDSDIPLRSAALVGCGVTTGVGAAINTAGVEPGSTVAVVGCGGVGLSIIQGARIAGARRIIGADLADHKLDMATHFGATDTVQASGDPVARVKELTDGLGVDYAFEAIGLSTTILQAHSMARRGGTAVIVGAGKITDTVSFSALMLFAEAKTIKGCYYGSVNARADFPMLIELYRRGKLDLDGMVTNTYRIEDAPQAFTDLEKGLNARGVIVFDT
ncbi:MAG: Zn-dependent alcohol dehydrogenase [Myxococcota bacterium]